jgi:hypothetical protein
MSSHDDLDDSSVDMLRDDMDLELRIVTAAVLLLNFSSSHA